MRSSGQTAVRKLGICLIVSTLLSLALTADASDSIGLTFSDSHPRLVWIADGLPSSAPVNAEKVASETFTLVNTHPGANSSVFVWDQTTGVIARRALSDLKSGSWTVKAEDYAYVADVRVSVNHDGKPVAAANVTLKDAQRSQNLLLDRTTSGSLDFFMVKPGSISVQVQYRSSGAMANPVNETFDLKPDSGSGSSPPTFTVSVPDSTETIDTTGTAAAGLNGSPASSTSGTSASGSGVGDTHAGLPGKAAPATNPVASAAIILVTILAVGFVGYKGIEYLKNNPEKARQTLEQLGAQIPKPADEQLNVGTPNMAVPAPAAPAPIPKIMLDPGVGGVGADPAVGSAVSMPSTGAAPASVARSGPSLRTAQGDEIPLGLEPLVVGRDAGLGLSLITESSVSRRHAEIVRRPEGSVLRDLGSTNGTFVNGAKLQGETVLRAGDEVRFGAAVFRYEA